jgi:hypothetical protein
MLCIRRLDATINQEEPRKNIMKQTMRTVSVAIIAALALPVVSFAKEKENEEETTVNMSDLPAEVQKTIKEKAGSNEIVRIEKETEEGKVVYQAEVKKNGKEWAFQVDASGRYLGKHDESKEHNKKGEKDED